MEEKALYYFRKLVYCLYHEIGILKRRNHPELAQKAKLNNSFFSNDRKRQAKELYHQTAAEEDLTVILKPYEKRTGLSLQDIYRIFEEGDWRDSSGGYSYGGPKWATIAKETIALCQAIDRENWSRIPGLMHKIDSLEHNNGRIVCKFGRTDY